MAEEVEMTPVEMTPVAAEPPKVNPLAKPGATVSTLKTGLKLPPKPGLGTGLKLPPKPGLGTGLKLPPKPGATVSGLKSGLKLPPKPGATVSALKTGLKLPPKPGLGTGLKLPSKPGATVVSKPIIRKPGAMAAAASLPKPIAPVSIPVDAQGVGKLPTVEAQAVDRSAGEAAVEVPKPLDNLKSITQKLKGITQAIPQQAILRKTGIIADPMSESLKEAAKHKTARISLSDALGVAPVQTEAAPMKTIRIKRPVNLPGAPSATAEVPKPVPAAPASVATAEPAQEAAAPAAAAPSTSVTQRKTLKISRPGAVRPTGKFGIKKPSSQATTVAKKPGGASAAAPGGGSAEGEVADIPDLPATASAPVPHPVEEAKPGFGTSLAIVVQLAASIAIGALAWFLYGNTQTMYF